jgi:rRNA maturation endonuclease Nob1
MNISVADEKSNKRVHKVSAAGKRDHKNNRNRDNAEDESEDEKLSPRDGAVLRGYLECRKQRRFAKYKKVWRPKYVTLMTDSLVYKDQVEVTNFRFRFCDFER